MRRRRTTWCSSIGPWLPPQGSPWVAGPNFRRCRPGDELEFCSGSLRRPVHGKYATIRDVDGEASPREGMERPLYYTLQRELTKQINLADFIKF